MHVFADYTVSQKRSHFYFLNNSFKNEPILIILAHWILEELNIRRLSVFPSHPHTVATVPGECQKSHFSAAACRDVGWTAAERRG